MTEEVEENPEALSKIESLGTTIDADYLAGFGYTKEQVFAYNPWKNPTLQEISDILGENAYTNLLADSYRDTLNRMPQLADDPVDVAVIPSRGIREGFSEKKVPFDTFSQKEVSLQEKERSKEKEYTLQEKDIPPYNPPTGDETDETIKGYLEFMRDHAYITEDLDNPSDISGIDFSLLSQKIAESSRYLQGKQSLKWLLRHYREIIGDSYKDFNRSSLPMSEGKGDLQLWQELVKALKAAKEERYCESVGRGSPIYLRLDGAADEEMKVIYRSLSPEIMAYFDPQSFLELCEMSDADLKFERARFLKALPEIRRKREGNDGVG